MDVFGVCGVALADIYFFEVMDRHGQIATDDLYVDHYFFVLRASQGVPVLLAYL